ncbi:RagB/SusD family nutrient uptake outer membrane protein [Sphingobacterium kyonggiense]
MIFKKMMRCLKNWKRSGIAIVLTGSLMLSTVSCDKFLDVESNHIVNESNKWKDINDIRSSLLGVYGLLRTALAEKNAHWMYGELRSGDFQSVSRRDLQNIIDGELNTSYDLLTNMSDWRRFYAVINAANLFIERSAEVIEHDSQYTTINNQADIAQMKVIKGFVYYLLARTWGDVPIWDKAYEGTFPKIKASSVNEVLTYAEKQILSVKDALPYQYGVSTDPVLPMDRYLGFSSSKWNGVLFNRLAAYAVLAHINAFEGNYLETVFYADFVMANAAKANLTQNDLNTLTGTTNTGFYFGNRAAHLLAFPFPNGSNEGTQEGHIESLTLAAPLVSKPTPDMFIPVEKIVSIFNEPGDNRFNIDNTGKVTTRYFSEFGGVRPIFSKIRMIRTGTSGTDGSIPLYTSTMVFTRYEEINLLRAEGYAALGQIDQARAIVNQNRKNRGLTDLNPAENIVDAVFNERHKELMGEGWRWFDLIRYQKIKNNNPEFLSLINSKGIFWPVNKQVLSANDQLEQNPFWK